MTRSTGTLPSTETPVRVLVVDDHALTLQGIVMTINAMEGFEVTATLPSGTDVVETVKREKIDITLLDLEIPEIDGLSILAALCGGLDATVIVLSGTGRARDFNLALGAGARAVLGKADSPDELILALQKARDGERHISTSIQAMLDSHKIPDITLSPRQLAILSMLSAGESNKEIGYKLGIAAPTVSFHLAELRTRVSADSNRKIIIRARELGLI